MKKAPALFVGHGSPLNVIENNSFNQKIKEMGLHLKEFNIQAIVCISAHYQTNGIQIDVNEKPKTIYDFTGFPEILYAMEYKAHGHPSLAKNILDLFKDFNPKTANNWGFDHGAWNVLWHLVPDANIPVVMISLDYNLSFDQHYKLGTLLKNLRDQGVMILGSGNIVHSFRGIDFSNSKGPYQPALQFEKYVENNIDKRNFSELIRFDQSIYEAAKFSVNSAEHYLPLLYVLGASEENEKPTIFNQQIVYSTLSMMSVAYGL
jgi:4,5-DOPA dioxygenase extradiol